MARYHGRVGFSAGQAETSPGVWEDAVVEKHYFGDVLRATRASREGQELNNDLSVANSISILADAYASENIFAMKYVEWAGALWTVSSVEERRPRLILQLGEVYNGPTPVGTSPDPG